MCNKCGSLDDDSIRKGIADGSIEVKSMKDLIEDGPKIGSVMTLNMVLDFLRKTNTATTENLKYLEDMRERIEKSSRDEQKKIKEDLIAFLNKVYEDLPLD